MKLIRYLIFLSLLSGCGPTLLSVGIIDVTTGDLAVQGVKKKILDDEKVFRGPGESISIPLGAKHRAWNETDEEIIFIEVQTGTYFGEDDIIRLQDDYDRDS